MSKLLPLIFLITATSILSCSDRGTVAHASVTSNITGIVYPIHIYIPPDYFTSMESYPVIYTTDGQWHFNSYLKAIRSNNKNIILVSVEQGVENRRSTDYLLPGSHDYYQFIITELLPSIESDYRIDQTQRTLSGSSFGGVFVALSLLEPDEIIPHFKNYLSFDGSFSVTPELIKAMEQDRYEASSEMNVNLMLTSALAAGNDLYVNQFQSMLEARNYSGLNIIRRGYQVVHSDILPISFDEALKLLF